MNQTFPAHQVHIHRRGSTGTQPLRYSVVVALCGSVVIAGFFFAARQHFASIDYGIKNSRLRRQFDELEAERRRLLLMREISLSPVELMKAAKRIGYTQTAAADPGRPATQSVVKSAATAAADVRSPMIHKTAMSTRTIPDDVNRTLDKSEKQAQKQNAAKEKKDKS